MMGEKKVSDDDNAVRREFLPLRLANITNL